ncbi:MAG TPA: hypothetical protein VNI57_01010 [Candidatus Saccharimonadales bacterium]|nr:hypothetical protein [Candidatus Saccharimonadales bacterium]
MSPTAVEGEAAPVIVRTSWEIRAETGRLDELRGYLRDWPGAEVIGEAGNEGLATLQVSMECYPGGVPEVHEALWSAPGVRSVILEDASRTVRAGTASR